MFTLGQTIDTKSAKRLYVTTRGTREIGMYRKGVFSPIYCITHDQVIIGVFTSRDEAEKQLEDIRDSLDVASTSQQKASTNILETSSLEMS